MACVHGAGEVVSQETAARGKVFRALFAVSHHRGRRRTEDAMWPMQNIIANQIVVEDPGPENMLATGNVTVPLGRVVAVCWACGPSPWLSFRGAIVKIATAVFKNVAAVPHAG